MEKYGVLYSFFKDDSVWTLSHFAAVTIRKFVFAFVLVYLNNYPIADSVCLIVMNLLLIYYMAKYKTYRHNIFLVRDIVCELSFSLIHTLSILLVL